MELRRVLCLVLGNFAGVVQSPGRHSKDYPGGLAVEGWKKICPHKNCILMPHA